MQLLCGTDFSESATAATESAAILANRWKDTLCLTHVVEADRRAMPRSVKDSLSTSALQRLHEEGSRVAKTGVSVKECVLAGSPASTLCDQAVKCETRLVVVASTATKSSEWLLGSVAERLVEHNDVPTLVVRDSSPFKIWARKKRPLKIFVAVDFSAASEKALRWVKQFVAAGECDIVLGYVDWPLGQGPRLGLGWAPLITHNPPEVQQILTRALRVRASELLGKRDIEVHSEPSMGRPDIRIIEMASEAGADLLVTGTHQRHGTNRLWHPSIARALLRYAPMNVLCVPSTSYEPTPQHSALVRRVLVVVENLKATNRAVVFAYGIINSGGTVQLVHVLPPPASEVKNGIPDNSQQEHAAAFQKAFSEARNALRDLIPEDAAIRDIATETQVIRGDDIVKAILSAADHFGTDVICLDGENAIHPGSIAEKLIHAQKRPVLITH